MSVVGVVQGPSARPTAGTLERYGLPGFFATSLIAVGGLAVGWIAPLSELASNPLLMAVRESAIATSVGKVAVLLGAGWLLRTWLDLARPVHGLDVARARAMGGLALLWSVPLLVTPVLFSRDVFSYVAASRLQPAGFDPYAVGTGALPTYVGDGADPMWADSPAPYGPLWMLVSTVQYHLTDVQADAALLAFRLVALAGVVLLVLFVPRLAAAAGSDPGRAVWLAVLNPVVLFHLTAAAHNDALMIGLLVAGITLALERRLLVGTALVAAAGAVKAPAFVVLPFVALLWAAGDTSWRRRLQSWAQVGGIALAALVGLSLLAQVGPGWLANLTGPAKVETWLSPTTALGRTLGFVGEATGFADPDAVLAAVRVAGTVATAGILLWLLVTASRRSMLRGAGLALLAVVALGPVVQPWYLLWPLPLLAASGLRGTELRWTVGLSLGMSAYTVANTAATTSALAALPEGVAALLAGAVVAAMLVVPRGTRQMLFERVGPRPRLQAAVPSEVGG
jgi:hypothetical protein